MALWNKCCFFMDKIDDNKKAKVRIGAYFLLFFLALLYGSSILKNVHLLIKCALGAVMMGVAILFSAATSHRKWKLHIPTVVLWLALGAVQLISGLLVSIEYLPMACIWLVGFPILFYVWQSRGDYEVLLYEVAYAGNLCFLIIIIGSAVFFPALSHSYGGMLRNTNGLGQWICFSFPLIYFLYYNAKAKWQKNLCILEAGFLFLFTILSESRTNLLTIVLMTLLAAVLQLFRGKINWKLLLKKIGILVLSIIIACGSFFVVNRTAYSIGNAINMSFQYAESLEQGNRPDNTKPKKDKDDQKNKHSNFVKHFASRVMGTDKIVNNLDDYSSGRVSIWITAINKTNLLGHPSRLHIVTDRNGDVGSNVHNTALQFLYDNGIAALILYSVMVIWVLFRILKAMLRRKKADTLYSTILIIQVGYLITAAFASLTPPFLYVQAFIYYLSYGIVIDKNFMPEKKEISA